MKVTRRELVIGAPRDPHQEEQVNDLIERLCADSGLTAFAAAFDSGREKDWEQAIDYALEKPDSA